VPRTRERKPDSRRPVASLSPGLSTYLDDALTSIIGSQNAAATTLESGLPTDEPELIWPGFVVPDIGDIGGDTSFDIPAMYEDDTELDAVFQSTQKISNWSHGTSPLMFLSEEAAQSSALVRRPSPQMQTTAPLYQQPSFEAGQDLITRLFQSQTCVVLSVKDDWEDNPWQSLIWPLTKTNPALKHAIVAMTCLQCCGLKPELHARGLTHFNHSIASLRRSLDEGTIRVDAALATTLALSLAKTWEAPRTGTDYEYINEARSLLKQAIANVDFTSLSAKQKQRLSFLANTWLYMDVITRLTSLNVNDNIDTELVLACDLLDEKSQRKIDPLLGCAADLFPLIGKVADLVRIIWRDESRRFSPALVGQAAELMRSVESWTPHIDLTSSGEPSNMVADAIQTAEAFRWSTILMLRQAVPALPGFTSHEQLAQKILVYLATIPASSGMISVHMFPLLIAGCEVTEQENRDWVSKRWKLMTNRLISGVVERCLDVTMEAWRRRDGQAGGAINTQVETQLSDEFDLATALFEEIVDTTGNNDDDGTAFGLQDGQSSTKVADLASISLPSRESRSQHSSEQSSTSLRSRLSWLAVMHDWKWQIMLG
jgi:hypothetical protein